MADQKLTALTETTSPATSDDVYVVTTPGGTPASRRCTIANLRTAMSAPVEGAWTDYSSSSTVVGWSSLSTKEIFYKQTGKVVHVIYNLQGTSNANNVTFTLPLAAVATPTINAWATWASDNSTNTIGYGTLAGGASTVTINKDPAATAWNTSGSKYAIGEFFYVTS